MARAFSTIRFLAALCLIISASWIIRSPGLAEPQAQTPPSKIIAIGDLHGDFQAYIDLLSRAGLIDEKQNWSGKDAIFVQTGDIADRGPDTLKIINHLKKLKVEAERDGGRVITLIGNHEAMNMTRDLRYVHPGEYKAFKTKNSKSLRSVTYKANQNNIEAFYRRKDPDLSDKEIKKAWMKSMPLGRLEHQQAWAPEGDIGSWVVRNPAVAIVDDVLFVHGGLSADYRHLSIETINDRVSNALRQQTERQDSIINAETGPLWYRGLLPQKSAGSSGNAEAEVERVLRNYDVDHIVVGHTPSRSGIRAHFGGRLIQIDTGASDHYGGTESFLRIEGGKLFAHDNAQIREVGEGP